MFNIPLRSHQSEGNSFSLCIRIETQISASGAELKFRECVMRGGQNNTMDLEDLSISFPPQVTWMIRDIKVCDIVKRCL